MFRKSNFHPQVDEYNPQDIPSCNVSQIIKSTYLDVKKFLNILKSKVKMKTENTDLRRRRNFVVVFIQFPVGLGPIICVLYFHFYL
jgi:hypothetical protein